MGYISKLYSSVNFYEVEAFMLPSLKPRKENMNALGALSSLTESQLLLG